MQRSTVHPTDLFLKRYTDHFVSNHLNVQMLVDIIMDVHRSAANSQSQVAAAELSVT